MLKYLIVSPLFIDAPHKYYTFPIGLAYISSTLKHAGYEVVCLNLNEHFEQTAEVITRAIIDKEIDVVLTGGLSGHFTKVRHILEVATEVKKDIFSVIGGGIVSADPKFIVETLQPDIGVIGEAEDTILEIAEELGAGRDFSNISGIVINNYDGTVTETIPRVINKDLGSIPHPDYEGFGLGRYLNTQERPSSNMNSLYEVAYNYFKGRRNISIIGSRSCPFDCTFCYQQLSRIYRERPLDELFSEVDHLVKNYQPTSISFEDDLFAIKRDRLEQFCKRIKYYYDNYGLQWACQMRVTQIDEDVLDLIIDAGCYMICYGIENVSDKILTSMKKKITRELVDHALALTHTKNIHVTANILIGDVADTEETVNENFDWCFHNRKYQLTIVPILTFPGTQLYQAALDDDVIKDPVKYLEKGCPPINISKMDDVTYFKQLHKMKHFRFSFTVRPIVHSVTPSDPMDEFFGRLYDVEVTCPECNASIIFERLRPHYSHIHKIGCKLCRKQFSLAPIVKAILPKRLDIKLQKSLQFAVSGQPDLGTQLLEEVITVELFRATMKKKEYDEMFTDRNYDFYQSNYAQIKEWCDFIAGAILLSRGDPTSFSKLSDALLSNPFSPDFHSLYAMSLRQNGDDWSAKYHEIEAENLTNNPSEFSFYVLEEDAQGGSGISYLKTA